MIYFHNLILKIIIYPAKNVKITIFFIKKTIILA